MKQIFQFVTAICACMLLTCCAQNKVTVSGQFDDFKGDSLLVVYSNLSPDPNAAPQEIVIPVDNGKFKWSTEVTELIMAYLAPVPKEGEQLVQHAFARAFLLPGEDVVISGTTLNNVVESPLNSVIQKFDKMAMEKPAMEVSDSAAAFIKANPDNPASAYVVGFLLKDIRPTVKLLSDEINNGMMATLLNARIDDAKHNIAMFETRQNVCDGAVAPDFTLQDVNGKSIALSSLRGKYVVLDFWGTWCTWCLKGMPQMKECYAKHQDKLEILGIACNDEKNRWEVAIEKFGMSWKNVFNPSSTDLLTTYAIEGFPTKIVLDPEGKVVKTFIGEDPKFYEFLDNLLK